MRVYGVVIPVSVGQSSGRVEVMLTKLDRGKQWSSLGVAGKHDATWVKTSTEGRHPYRTVHRLSRYFVDRVAGAIIRLSLIHISEPTRPY